MIGLTDKRFMLMYRGCVCKSVLLTINGNVCIAADILPFARVGYPSDANVILITERVMFNLHVKIQYFVFKGEAGALLFVDQHCEGGRMRISVTKGAAYAVPFV